MEMKPGSYIGKDGRAYAWKDASLNAGFIDHYDDGSGALGGHAINVDDLDAALDALKALVEDRKVEYIPLDTDAWVSHGGGSVELVRRDGELPVLRTNVLSQAGPLVYGRDIYPRATHGSIADLVDAAYRAGLERGKGA